MEQFRQRLGFYSCTVPSFEQYTLERFLRRGYFEKHINRMRKAYKARRNEMVTLLRESPFASHLTILEQDAGLHFLVRVQTDRSDAQLEQLLEAAGIRVRALSSYYHGAVPESEKRCLVINYSGLQPEQIQLLREKIQQLG